MLTGRTGLFLFSPFHILAGQPRSTTYCNGITVEEILALREGKGHIKTVDQARE